MAKKKKRVITKTEKLGFIFLLGIVMLVTFFIVGSVLKKDPLPFPGPQGHQPGSFSFINQNGQRISDKNVEGKVTVVEFFFTTCPGICKVMNKNLEEVYQAFRESADVCILSHTVDPIHDSVSVLRKYAAGLNVSAPVWQFLTGDKEQLYKVARIDYLLAVDDPPADIENDFIHTEYVALLDKNRRIRGFYNMAKSDQTKKLIDGIKNILEE